MPLDFPNSPTIGQVYTAVGITWTWDGVRWESVIPANAPYLPLSGVNLPTSPTSPNVLPPNTLWRNGDFICVT